jgi:hypothetical protein
MMLKCCGHVEYRMAHARYRSILAKRIARSEHRALASEATMGRNPSSWRSEDPP